MKRKFADVVEMVTTDKRTHTIPILFVIQVLIVCDDLGLFGGSNDEQILQSDESETNGTDYQ